jgi:hypothetical protein
VIKECKGGSDETYSIQFKNKSTIRTVLYADYKVVTGKSEDELQMVVHQLNNIARNIV